MAAVTLLLHGGLARLCRQADDNGRVRVPLTRGRSVKDAVESVGVPHTEVGHLAVDGQSVTFDHLVHDGEVVAIRDVTDGPWHDSLVTPPTPPHPVRFVADVHLGTLARRLRLLGLDTWWRNDADDPNLAAIATDQDRVLLTRDRQLLMRRVIVHGMLLRSEDPATQLDQVTTRLDLQADIAPRTRCVVCNGRIRRVPRSQIADQLEPGTRAAHHDRFGQCLSCGRIYWPGAHDDDLQRIVDAVTWAGDRARTGLAGRSPE